MAYRVMALIDREVGHIQRKYGLPRRGLLSYVHNGMNGSISTVVALGGPPLQYSFAADWKRIHLIGTASPPKITCAHMVMAYVVMPHIVVAHIVMAYIVMTYTVMAYTVMA